MKTSKNLDQMFLMFPRGTAVSEINSIKCVKETIFEKLNDFEMRKRGFYEIPKASGQSNHWNRISLTTEENTAWGTVMMD